MNTSCGSGPEGGEMGIAAKRAVLLLARDSAVSTRAGSGVCFLRNRSNPGWGMKIG